MKVYLLAPSSIADHSALLVWVKLYLITSNDLSFNQKVLTLAKKLTYFKMTFNELFIPLPSLQRSNTPLPE